MIFLGKITEKLQYGTFSENLMPTLHKEMKNKASVLKIDVSCFFHSSPRGVFRTLLSI